MPERRNVLVTGGAGYIGSHTCLTLLEAGVEVVVSTTSSNSSEVALERVARARSRGRRATLEFDAATSATPTASTARLGDRRRRRGGPLRRAQGGRRVGGRAAALLRRTTSPAPWAPRAMERHGVRDLVFSSSCTVYGEPERRAHHRGHAALATNPYGRTKLLIEEMLRDLAATGAAGASRCCATSTRSARTRAGASARTRSASPTT